MRTSGYTIYVDLPDNDREMLLVHGYTGAYDKVSRRVVNYLRAHESGKPPKPLYGEWTAEPQVGEDVGPPSEAVLATLKKRGYLTRWSPAEEEAFFKRFALRLHERVSNRMPSYIFMPTYNCNLRCGYCFQDHMRTDGAFSHLLHTMSRSMVDRIFAAMPAIEARHGIEPDSRERRSIGLFGGEPLLARHREIVAYIYERGMALGEADFWAVTNATEIDAYRDLLGPGKIARLQITLDGPPSEHDKRRIYADGSGSFECIASNIQLALELGTLVSIRLNIDHNNIADLPAVAAEIKARGWQDFANFSVYTAPINAVNDKTDRKTTMNSWELDKALTEMRREHPDMRLIGRPDESIRVRARHIFEGQENIVPAFRPSFCGAHDQMYILDPFGDVYACWERTGEPSIRMAHITEAGELELEHEIHREWRSRSVASNPVCSRCRYALHCGGGCAVLALGRRGKFHANFCDGFASRFRASVAEAYHAYLAGEQSLHDYERLCDL